MTCPGSARPLPRHRRRALPALLGAGLLLAWAGSARAQGGPDYAPEQADAGRTAYESACAACHTSTLQGSFEAPELAGPNFLNRWGGRPVSELIDYVRATMPPDGARPSEAGYVSIIAYILQRNGVAAGERPAASRFGGGDRRRRRPAASRRAASAPDAGGRAGSRARLAGRGGGLPAGHRCVAARPAAGRLAELPPHL